MAWIPAPNPSLHMALYGGLLSTVLKSRWMFEFVGLRKRMTVQAQNLFTFRVCVSLFLALFEKIF